MYHFKISRPENWWMKAGMETEEDIRTVAADVDKAINIIVEPWRRLYPF